MEKVHGSNGTDVMFLILMFGNLLECSHGKHAAEVFHHFDRMITWLRDVMYFKGTPFL